MVNRNGILAFFYNYLAILKIFLSILLMRVFFFKRNELQVSLKEIYQVQEESKSSHLKKQYVRRNEKPDKPPAARSKQ